MDRREFVSALGALLGASFAGLTDAEYTGAESVDGQLKLSIALPPGIDPSRMLLGYRWNDGDGWQQYLGPLGGSPHFKAVIERGLKPEWVGGPEVWLTLAMPVSDGYLGELQLAEPHVQLAEPHVEVDVSWEEFERMPHPWPAPKPQGTIRPFRAARPGRQRARGWR